MLARSDRFAGDFFRLDKIARRQMQPRQFQFVEVDRLEDFERSFRIPFRQQLPTTERFFAAAAWVVVALHLSGVLPTVIDGLEQVSFSIGKAKVNLWMLLQGALTVFVTVLVALWVAGIIESRLMRTEGLDGNLKLVFTRLSRSLLVVLAVAIGLPLVGIDLTALSVFGGALGVGLGVQPGYVVQACELHADG